MESNWTSRHLLFGLALLLATHTSGGQLISLRHPESNRPLADHRRPPSNELSPRLPARRDVARPGNVIVHFDQDHEISRLQYVLQDGRVATLFQRPSERPAAAPTGGGARPTTSGPSPSEAHRRTIEVVDSHSDSAESLAAGGGHLLLELPLGPEQQLALAGQDGAANSTLVAQVAEDLLENGIQLGEQKLGQLASKLRAKLSAKLHELPHLVGRKLRQKSAAGGHFVDLAGGRHEELGVGPAHGQVALPMQQVGGQQPPPPGAERKMHYERVGLPASGSSRKRAEED